MNGSETRPWIWAAFLSAVILFIFFNFFLYVYTVLTGLYRSIIVWLNVLFQPRKYSSNVSGDVSLSLTKGDEKKDLNSGACDYVTSEFDNGKYKISKKVALRWSWPCWTLIVLPRKVGFISQLVGKRLNVDGYCAIVSLLQLFLLQNHTLPSSTHPQTNQKIYFFPCLHICIQRLWSRLKKLFIPEIQKRIR